MLLLLAALVVAVPVRAQDRPAPGTYVRAAEPDRAPGRISLGATFALTLGAPVGAVVVAAIGVGIGVAATGGRGTEGLSLGTAIGGPIGAVLGIPLAVAIVGDLMGGRSHYGWALLGSVIGAIPGFVVVAAAGTDSGRYGVELALGSAAAGAGAIAGSIFTYELTGDDDFGEAPVSVVPVAGPGGIGIAAFGAW